MSVIVRQKLGQTLLNSCSWTASTEFGLDRSCSALAFLLFFFFLHFYVVCLIKLTTSSAFSIHIKHPLLCYRALFIRCTLQQGVHESRGRSSPVSCRSTSAHGLSSSLSSAEGRRSSARPPFMRSMSESVATVMPQLQAPSSTGAHYFNVDRWNASIGEFDEFSW